MRRYVGRPGFWLLAALSLGACDGSRENRIALAGLEERVGLLERAPTTVDSAPDAPDVAADLRSLERRLAEVERRLAAVVAASPAASAAGAAGGTPVEGRIEQRRERRLRLRDLTDQYRTRLVTIREQHTDPAARQQAVREALEWYRAERHEILADAAPPAP
jgi:hypothetical protein